MTSWECELSLAPCRPSVHARTDEYSSSLNLCRITSPSNTLDFETAAPALEECGPLAFEDPLSLQWLSTSRQCNKTCGCLWLASDVHRGTARAVRFMGPILHLLHFHSRFGKSQLASSAAWTQDGSRRPISGINDRRVLHGSDPQQDFFGAPMALTLYLLRPVSFCVL